MLTLTPLPPRTPPQSHLPPDTLVLVGEAPVDDAWEVLEAVAWALRQGGQETGGSN